VFLVSAVSIAIASYSIDSLKFDYFSISSISFNCFVKMFKEKRDGFGQKIAGKVKEMRLDLGFLVVAKDGKNDFDFEII
jgi:hypothetical protein